MDPVATLAVMRDPDAHPSDRIEAADDLAAWLTRGGFAPEGYSRHVLAGECAVTVREIRAGLTCIANTNGLTLWDCECTECHRLQVSAP